MKFWKCSSITQNWIHASLLLQEFDFVVSGISQDLTKLRRYFQKKKGEKEFSYVKICN